MNVCILQILYFDRIDVFKETDVNKLININNECLYIINTIF